MIEEEPPPLKKLSFMGRMRIKIVPYTIAITIGGSVGKYITPVTEQPQNPDTITYVDNYQAIKGERPILAGDRGVFRDAEGTLNIPYNFEESNQLKLYRSDPAKEIINPLKFNNVDKKILLEEFRYLESVINVKFFESQNPDSNYIANMTYDLSEHKNGKGEGKSIAGFGRMPNKSGAHIVLNNLIRHKSLNNKDYENSVRSVIKHELGHVLGLEHPHAEVFKKIALIANQDNSNSTTMSYQDSNPKSDGGQLTKRYSDISLSYQIYDLQALIELYGHALNRPKVLKHEFTLKNSNIKTITNGSERTEWIIPEEKSSRSSFINLSNQIKDVSYIGDSYFWALEAPHKVDVASSTAQNQFFGFNGNVTIIDGDGSSVFNVTNGVDSITTNDGFDIIQMNAQKGLVIATDFDVGKDMIEYDETAIECHQLGEINGKPSIIFMDMQGNPISAVQCPNLTKEELEFIHISPASGSMLTPYQGANVNLKKNQNYFLEPSLNRAYFSLEHNDASQLEVSYKDGRTYWQFKDAQCNVVNEVSARGIVNHDLIGFRCRTNSNLYQNFRGEIKYIGFVPDKGNGFIHQHEDGTLTSKLDNSVFVKTVNAKNRVSLAPPHSNRKGSGYSVWLLNDGFVDRKNYSQEEVHYTVSHQAATNIFNSNVDKLEMLGDSIMPIKINDNGLVLVGYDNESHKPVGIFTILKFNGDLENMKPQIFRSKQIAEMLPLHTLQNCPTDIKNEVKAAIDFAEQQDAITQKTLHNAKWQMQALATPSSRQL